MNLLGYPEPPRPRGGNRGGASNQIKKEIGKWGYGVQFRVCKSLCFPGGCGAPGGGESARESTLTETVWPGSVQPGAHLVPGRRPPGWNLVPGGFQFHRGLVPVGSNFAATWSQCGVHFARTWLQACCDLPRPGTRQLPTWPKPGHPDRRVCVCVCVCASIIMMHPSL